MADRVAFLTHQWYTPDFTPTRPEWVGFGTGFPFTPVVDSGMSVASPGYHPLGISLLDCVRWYWRIRTVQIDLSFNGLIDELPHTYSATVPWGSGGVDATRERNLCFFGDRLATKSVSPNFLGGGSTSEFGFFFCYVFTPTASPPIHLLDRAPLYHPRMRIYAGATGSGERVSSNNASWTANPAGVATLFGESVPLYGADPSYIFNVTITPASYWPYANSNGDPVYDATTGAQLVDPLS